jgi:hypothetical protein
MHSDGRGEETPEAYRGVVIPAGRQQPPATYGEHVQPAGGTPWGEPAPAVPEPADATQMLPPYPGSMPPPAAPAVPEPADATQMLPPYPGGDPGAPGAAAGPGPVPPLPPVPPQAPPVPPHTPPQAPQPPVTDATQALPLSIFQDREQEQYGAQPQPPQQQSYEQPYAQPYDGYSQGYDQPQYGGGQQQYGQPQYEQGPQQGVAGQGGPQPGVAGQGGPGQGGYEQGGYEEPQQGPGHDSDYDHLFRSDVPSPEPLRQRIIQPPSQKQPQPQQYAQQSGGPGQPTQQPYDPAYGPAHDQGQGYDDGRGGGRRRKLSPAAVIGIVVAGCVVAGLVVGGLMTGGDGGDKDKTASKPSTQPSAPTSASASGSTDSAAASAAEQQAQGLDTLLKTSGNSRSSVVAAVESIKNCDNLGPAATDLRSAATQRTGLVSQLQGLPVDKLPGHAALTEALTKAWQASAAADGHYAAWADQAAHNHKVCKGGHARITGEAQDANRESGAATEQKKRAVRLWNVIAKQYGLTERQYSQL